MSSNPWDLLWGGHVGVGLVSGSDVCLKHILPPHHAAMTPDKRKDFT